MYMNSNHQINAKIPISLPVFAILLCIGMSIGNSRVTNKKHNHIMLKIVEKCLQPFLFFHFIVSRKINKPSMMNKGIWSHSIIFPYKLNLKSII